MSASITHKDQQPSECGKQRHCGEDMSFNHETGEIKGYTPPEKSGCHCNENPYKEQYEKLIAEAEAARDEFLQKAKDLEGIAKETNATANKEAILAAIAKDDDPSFIECTIGEIDRMFEEEV